MLCSWPMEIRIVRSLLALFLLYAVQGVPFGFIDNFLPLILYDGGASLSQVGLIGCMGMPWMFKWVWAPLVDAYGSPTFGRRKSWIIPAHMVMICCCLLCSLISQSLVDGGMSSSVAAVLLLWATATAVEDCAVDGFAISLIENADPESPAGQWMLALANLAQVVGFKAGYIYSGAPLWRIYQQYGWSAHMWFFLALPIVVVALLAATTPEPATKHESAGLRSVVSSLKELLLQKDTCHLMLFAASYKIGEKVLMSMFKPSLIDAGYGAADVGIWLGTYGTISSLVGSALASLYMPRCDGVAAALRHAFIARTVLFVMSLIPILPPQLALALQGFGAGVITPIMFAFLMEVVSGSSCAVTHYTVLQCCDDFSRTAGQAAAGYVATYLGFRATFLLSIVASLAPLTLGLDKAARKAD